MFWQFAGTAFGITAALIIAGGWVLLQYKRDQMHYKVLTLALERGMSVLPGRVPGWIRSMWQGVLIVLVGAGVLVAGVLLQMEAAAGSQVTVMPPRAVEGSVPVPPATHAGPGGGPPPPLMDMPRLERLERLRLIGLINMCAGGVLVLLGIARVAFARLERRYIDEMGAFPKTGESIHSNA